MFFIQWNRNVKTVNLLHASAENRSNKTLVFFLFKMLDFDLLLDLPALKKLKKVSLKIPDFFFVPKFLFNPVVLEEAILNSITWTFSDPNRAENFIDNCINDGKNSENYGNKTFYFDFSHTVESHHWNVLFILTVVHHMTESKR